MVLIERSISVGGRPKLGYMTSMYCNLAVHEYIGHTKKKVSHTLGLESGIFHLRSAFVHPFPPTYKYFEF